MKENTFPIGTIVSVQNKQAMIVGYTMTEKAGHMRNAYIVVPYPEGFVSPSSLKIAEAGQVSLTAAGYESEYSRYVTQYIAQVGQAAENLSADKMRQALEITLGDRIKEEES